MLLFSRWTFYIQFDQVYIWDLLDSWIPHSECKYLSFQHCADKQDLLKQMSWIHQPTIT